MSARRVVECFRDHAVDESVPEPARREQIVRDYFVHGGSAPPRRPCGKLSSDECAVIWLKSDRGGTDGQRAQSCEEENDRACTLEKIPNKRAILVVTVCSILE